MIKELLEKRDRAELLEFLSEYAEKDEKFANAVYVRFGKPDFRVEVNKIEKKINDLLDGITDYHVRDSWGNVSIYTGDIIDEIRQRANQGHVVLAFTEIELLYRKLLNAFEYQGECEISDEAEYCVTVMSDIADKATAEEDKELIFQRCIDLASIDDGKNYGADYEDKLLGISAKFVTSGNRARLDTALSSFEMDRREEAFKLIRFALISKFDGADTENRFIAENLKFDKIRIIAYERAMLHKDFIEAEKLCKDAIAKEQSHYRVSSWKHKLFDVYNEEGNVEKTIAAAKEILLEGDKTYYYKLKALLQQQGTWDSQYKTLLQELSVKLYASYFMNILAEEQEYELLIEQLRKHTDSIFQYGEILAHMYPDDICGIFKEQLCKEADSAKKRSAYRDVCTHISVFSKTGYKAEAADLIRELIIAHKGKPAFTDELRTLT